MHMGRPSNLLSAILAIALLTNLAFFLHKPEPVAAQAGNVDPIYFEPGVYMLRLPDGGQVLGKVVVNLRTGGVWGFPTNSSNPYPMSPIDTRQQTSHAVPLGRFALAETAH